MTATAPAEPISAPSIAWPEVEWEETSCLLCGGNRSATVIEAADAKDPSRGLVYNVVRCQDCGLCYTNPRPSPRTIGHFYPAMYRPHRGRRSARPKRWWRRLPLLSKKTCPEHRVLPWHGQGRLLDFGCGGGRLLERMHRAGWQVTGMDCSLEAVQSVRQHLKLPILHGSLPHPDLVGNSFDVITMMHSLEHVHQPLEVLRAARRLLAPGGMVVVSLPNIASMPFRVFGGKWYALDLPRHLTHFTPQTLTLMLRRAGFKPGPVRMIRHSEWLRASARLASASAPVWQRCLQYKLAAWCATWYGFLTQQNDGLMVSAVKAG